MEYLLRTPRAASVESILTDRDVLLHLPALCDVEVAAGLRRALLANKLSASRAQEALDDYEQIPATRHGHLPLLPRVLALRDNFSVYDATYVALAEGLGAALLTADRALARAASRMVPTLG